MTLRARFQARLEEIRSQSMEKKCQDWDEQTAKGETLFAIISGEHWQATRPDLRTQDQNRAALIHSLKQLKQEKGK